jgi:hypothetical protein
VSNIYSSIKSADKLYGELWKKVVWRNVIATKVGALLERQFRLQSLKETFSVRKI